MVWPYNIGMLLCLRIENYVLIDTLSLDFLQGISAFTGETGAGKSMIVDALAIAAGARVSPDLIRQGAKRAVIEAEFALSPEIQARIEPFLEEADITLDDPQTLTLVREISERGGKCRIDGQVVPLGLLRQVGDCLLDILGQHEHQHLMKPSHHLAILDDFGGVGPIREAHEKLYAEIRSLEAEHHQLLSKQQEYLRTRDFWQFQLEELTNASLSVDEEESLKSERIRLAHLEELQQKLREAYELLESGDAVGRALSLVEGAARFDSGLDELVGPLAEAIDTLTETGREIRNRLEGMEADPERLDSIEERLDLIQTLKRKYGSDIPAMLQFRDELEKSLAQGVEGDTNLAQLAATIEGKQKSLIKQAQILTKARSEASVKLKSLVEAELSELGMPRARIDLPLSQGEIGPHGQDSIEFMMAPNPGEPVRPLAKTASGGELARLMLAFKTVLAQTDPTPTMIFDEVDTGISGQAAQVVAEKVAKLSSTFQILLITHLPAMAAVADQHWQLEKRVAGERTIVEARSLDDEGREAAIAQMIAGSPTEVSLKHAKELITQARKRHE